MKEVRDSMENHDNEALEVIVLNCIRGGNTEMLARAQGILEKRGVKIEKSISA